MNIDKVPLVSIIIVNYDEEQFLVPLLESIQKFEPSLSKEVLILNNHSSRDVAALLQDRFTETSLINCSDNEGFGRTNNKGMRMVNGKYILLLNPDTLFRDSSISSCIHYFDSHHDELIGAVGCRLQSEDGTHQKSFFRLAASIKKTLQLNPLFIKLNGNSIKRIAEYLDNVMHEKISNPPWLCGAFLLLNREVVLKQQFFFDEDFFLYSEDCELGHRMNKRGYRLVYLPDQFVIHYGGGASPFLQRFGQLTISEWLCTMKIYGKFYYLLNQLLLLCNWLVDHLLFYKNVLLKTITFRDKREKIIRRKLWLLWLRYTFRILFRYSRNPSSSKVMLKYQQSK